MPLKNTDTRYGSVTKTLHWSIVLLVLLQFAIGAGEIELFGDFDDVHGTLGITVLALAAVRLAWRLALPLPDWAPALTRLDRELAHAVELTLYAMLFAKPITGLLLMGADDDEVEFMGLYELPALWPESDAFEDLFETAHFVSGVILLVALALHVGLVLRRRLLHRMLPFSRGERGRRADSIAPE